VVQQIQTHAWRGRHTVADSGFLLYRCYFDQCARFVISTEVRAWTAEKPARLPCHHLRQAHQYQDRRRGDQVATALRE
jgi:hypothetical protein